jgi:hypothetical protein
MKTFKKYMNIFDAIDASDSIERLIHNDSVVASINSVTDTMNSIKDSIEKDIYRNPKDAFVFVDPTTWKGVEPVPKPKQGVISVDETLRGIDLKFDQVNHKICMSKESFEIFNKLPMTSKSKFLTKLIDGYVKENKLDEMSIYHLIKLMCK